MYRRVVLSSPNQTKGNSTILYRVHGAIPLSQYRRYHGKYNQQSSSGQWFFPFVFDDSVKISVGTTIQRVVTYEIVLDVDENQPDMESVEEITTEGINITVYNADGVIVCHNGVGISAESSPAQTVAPGEMTSEPIDGPGEMTSEPIEGPGEMTSAPGEEPGEMI